MFYDKFVLLCNSKRITPSAVLNLLQISKSCVTRWKGGGMPTDAHCKKIADFFAVSVEQLKNETISNDTLTCFYNRFLKLCNDSNLSPANVANELNLSRPTITRWKNGSIPRDYTINKIADFFGVPYSYFTNSEENNHSELSLSDNQKKNQDNIRKAANILELVNIAQELPENKLITLLNVAQAMKE